MGKKETSCWCQRNTEFFQCCEEISEEVNTMNEKVIAILDVFEDLLDSKGIEIPCEDEREQDERHDGGNDAKIYGTEYGELYDAI